MKKRKAIKSESSDSPQIAPPEESGWERARRAIVGHELASLSPEAKLTMTYDNWRCTEVILEQERKNQTKVILEQERKNRTRPASEARLGKKELATSIVEQLVDMAHGEKVRKEYHSIRAWLKKKCGDTRPLTIIIKDQKDSKELRVEFLFSDNEGKGVEMQARRGKKRLVVHDFIVSYNVRESNHTVADGTLTSAQLKKAIPKVKPISTK